MHDNRPNPLLAQVPLTVSPFVSLPTATTLPYTYKTLPSTLPPSSTGTPASSSAEEKAPYVVSTSGHGAHPDEIIASCRALQAYIQKVQDDADKELREWDEAMAARELAEKRRVAPGWLDSDARILEPERKDASTSESQEQTHARGNLMDADVSRADAPSLPNPTVATSSGVAQGDELDRAFGGLVPLPTSPNLIVSGGGNSAPRVDTMLPRIPRAGIVLSRSRPPRLSNYATPKSPQICPICTSSPTLRFPSQKSRRSPELQQHRATARRQFHSANSLNTAAAKSPTQTSSRAELRSALLDLQKHAGNYVNISRLQLALRGIEQTPGDETIRIAILGLADGGNSLQKAKQLLRLLLADPLKDEEKWEQILLDSAPGGRPLLVRVGHDSGDQSGYSSRMVQELHVSSPMLNGHKLEILVLETDPPTAAVGADGSFEETVLVPTMEIPTSNTGRYTPVTTPVHRSLLVSQGIVGAASLLSAPPNTDRTIINLAVDLQYKRQDEEPPLPFQIIDVSLGTSAVVSFRESVRNALDYEHNWSASGAPEVLKWLKAGTAPVEGTMKLPVRRLIESVLENTNSAIQAEQARQLSTALTTKVSDPQLRSLQESLTLWAERAHTELRDQLDIAFNGRRWEKLKWWKLFWRVDDVSMITTDILNQRFLRDAEEEIIFLAGRIQESGITTLSERPDGTPRDWPRKPVPLVRAGHKLGAEPPPPRLMDISIPEDGIRPPRTDGPPWPSHILLARSHFISTTVSSLQATAQSLVLQALGTSAIAGGLAGLVHAYNILTPLFAATAVPAQYLDAYSVAGVGIVFALWKLQGKWELSRKRWEGEVRECGRSTIQALEEVVGGVLRDANKASYQQDPDLEKAMEIARKVEEALKALDIGRAVAASCYTMSAATREGAKSDAPASPKARDDANPEPGRRQEKSHDVADAEDAQQEELEEGEEVEESSKSRVEAHNGATEQSGEDGTTEAPPLPEEAIPPLPEEEPPAAGAENDDGWAPVWEESAQAFYFYNRLTGASQWTNPRVPDAEAPQPGPPGVESPAPTLPTTAPPTNGYNPAIHGDYDPTAWYAQPAAAEETGAGPADPAAAYAATAAFNRFTGRFQNSEITPENYNDENKSKRQMNAFFDVDAAANSHDGRSLKAERSGKKLSKTELKQFKEKRKARKEEKRRAWLRD
ncbi:uncharacterized protein BP5553_03005 [Venustampulla echinocandica]|uniref:WW domain-containing protein n=1 Tax=Venustampulla echinocandica TaxID=2656787 RepID=A0A370TT09_9HELO|nr:uncharacterized protein BP5553_03005 [Venustampulla echinocandica]RDL38665.1 hypothetical protein BP5553_03005 [Venustampulla echinocandica]